MGQHDKTMGDGGLLWQPNQMRIDAANITRFTSWLEKKTNRHFPHYQSLHDFSCQQLGDFWWHFWDYAGVVGHKGQIAVSNPNLMPLTPQAGFFPDARINFAENMLRPNDNAIDPDRLAMLFGDERGRKRQKTRRHVIDEVMQLARALESWGVKAGDRVAAFMPNLPETMIAMLATSSIGAIFTSCSPDFGVAGVLDRFGQTAPTVLIACDGYYYAGKDIDSRPRLNDITAQLPTLKKIIMVPFLDETGGALPNNRWVWWADALTGQSTARQFTPLPFDHPLFIMYSSGTTGVPKCIVHGAGGTMLKFMVEHQLHTDLKKDDRLFFFTTCGWMMWNWLLGGIHTGATLCLFDGSPFHPDPAILWRCADDWQCSHFGISAKYIDSLKKSGYEPIKQQQLKNLRMLLTTGSPLSAESFDFIYESIKSDLQVASISGGTDILGCFLAGVPTLPVHRGELQAAVLGMAVEIYDDQNDNHPHPLTYGRGELVCTKPFPSMPIYFWNDETGQKYHQAYFARYPHIWYHGDFLERTKTGFIIHGRSDATLNPGGVRIGTAEIYRQVEQLPEVIESVAIGQDWQQDVRVVLFVRLQPDQQLTDQLIATIKKRIRDNCSPRHVPAKIIAVADIPRTKSGKITELAVREVVMGQPIKNKEALANPEALDCFRQLKELES